MKARNSITAFCIFLCTGTVATAWQKVNPDATPLLLKGVVVEFLTTGQEGEKAGIQPGDVLLHWSRDNETGEIESPFDLNYLKVEQASRGTLKLEGYRGSEPRTWSLGPDYWGIWVHPNFQGELLSTYREELELAEAGELTRAVSRWRSVEAVAQESGIPWLNPWFLSHAAQVASRRQRWDGYDDAYRESIQNTKNASPIVKAELARQWAGGFYERGEWTNAQAHYDEALTEWRKLGSRTMALSSALKDVGMVAILQGNFSKAQTSFREALGIAQDLAPFSSLAAWDLIDLGFLSYEAGDLAGAEDYFRRALAIEQRISPSSSDLAWTLQNLGWVADRRGDLAKAEDYFRKALAVAEKLGPNSQYFPDILSSLAECVLDRGNPEAAEKYETRALAIRKKQTGDDLAVASSLRNLGKIARVRGDLAKADEYYHSGLAIMEKTTPPPPSITRFLMGIGYVARERGDFRKAEEYYRRALTIMEEVAPGSLDHAETMADLAGALRNQKQLDAAAKIYQRAMSEMENKTARLGGVDEDRSRYRAQHDRYYREYVDVLVAQGQPELAFQVLEGSRARTLLEVLARADINVRGDINPSLVDRERNLQQLRNAQSAYRLRLLSGKHSEEQLKAVNKEIEDLLDQYQQVEAEVRVKSPGYAALTQPQPLGACPKNILG